MNLLITLDGTPSVPPSATGHEADTVFSVYFSFNIILSYNWGRDSSVGIATRYGLEGPGIESRWGGGRDFSHLSRPALGPHPASCTVGTGCLPGVKRPVRGADHPPPSSAEVEGRVELYICSTSGPSWPVIG